MKTVVAALAACLIVPATADASYLYVREAKYRTDRLASSWKDYTGHNVGRCSRSDRHHVVCDLVMYRQGEQCLYRSHVTRTDGARGRVTTATRLSYVWCEARGSHG